MKIYRNDHADTNLLKDENILIIGYGSQGRAFAQNLRDSGFDSTICLPPKSKSGTTAQDDEFTVIEPSDISSDYSMILMLLPDHLHGEFYDRYLAKMLSAGHSLVFAHAYSIHFGLISPNPQTDVILLAPHGPGVDLRSLYLDSNGLSAFLALKQDSSGMAHAKGLALAKAIGCTRSGVFETTFEHEALGDIFGEQALLCGGLAQLVERTFEIMVKNGLPPENAYLETVHQIDLLAGLIKKHGIAGMMERISMTAQFGMQSVSGKIIDDSSTKRMQKIYDEIKSGEFSRKWQNEYAEGLPGLKRYRQEQKSAVLEKTAKKLSRELKK